MNTCAVYELDEDGEALGIVHFYCSYGHAEADIETGAYDGIPVTTGVDDDFPDGTVCERCNIALRTIVEPIASDDTARPITTLLFATDSDAAPLIHLNAPPADVRAVLARQSIYSIQRALPTVPGIVAVKFLFALSPDQIDDWQPRIESTPVFCAEAVADMRAAYGDTLLAWDSAAWREIPADPCLAAR